MLWKPSALIHTGILKSASITFLTPDLLPYAARGIFYLKKCLKSGKMLHKRQFIDMQEKGYPNKRNKKHDILLYTWDAGGKEI